MTKRQFVVIAFRLFAVYFTFNLITTNDYRYDIIYQLGTNDRQWFLATVCSIFIALFFITLLWVKSEWLMEKVFAIPALSEKDTHKEPEHTSNEHSKEVTEIPPNSDGNIDYYETPISAESVQLIAFSIIGIWVTLFILPDFLRTLQFCVASIGSGSFGFLRASIESNTTYLAGLAAIEAVGIWMFLRPWQVQELIEKFKRKNKSRSDGKIAK